MKKYLFLLLVVLLGACTQYQYVTLNGSAYHSEQQNFVWENDTVRIRYIFSGYNCPLTVQVYNKMAQPLYVDWKKSAVVYGDGSSLSLWNDQVNVSSVTVGESVRVGNLKLGTAQTSGVMEKRDQISFIPPNSYISVRPLAVMSTFIRTLPAELKRKVSFGDGSDTKVEKYSFTEENTPFAFRCFLTLSATDNFSTSLYIDQPFWVSEIMQTSSVGPSSVLPADNMFYVSRTTSFGHIMGGVGTVAVVAGAVYLDAATEPGPPPPHHRR